MGESFFQRWSRRKAEQSGEDKLGREQSPAGTSPAPVSSSSKGDGDAPGSPLPTIEDVAQLTRESDYSMFLAKGIDPNVRRAAMKKLFADPHFNVMDGLDIYIDDYTKPSPLTPVMLAALQHTQSMFEAVANEERAREEREKSSREPATESEQTQEGNAPPEHAQNGDAELQHDVSVANPAENHFAGLELPEGMPHVLPYKEEESQDESANSIRHRG